MSGAWSGSVVRMARAVVVQALPTPCPRCGETVSADQPWVVGHKVARSLRPDLALDPLNWQAEHRACSDRTGQAAVIEKARAEAFAEVGVFPDVDTSG